MKEQRSLTLFILISLLLFGLYYMPVRIMGSELSFIPGDHGGARLILYQLEHGYQYLIGNVSSYWNANFFFPAKSAMAYSESSLGTILIYSLFRWMSFDDHTSFQLWIITMFGLNYLISFVAFKKIFQNSFVSIFIAYIFAFGLYNLGQLNHLQLLPRFFIPLTLMFFYSFLKKGKLVYLSYACIALFLQFLCGRSLGIITLYGLLLLSVLCPIFFRNDIKNAIGSFSFKKVYLLHFALIISSLVALFYLLAPYQAVLDGFAERDFEQIKNSIPRLRSYFFSPPTSTLWGKALFSHSAFKFDQWWVHFLYPGILPFLCFLSLIPLGIKLGFKNLGTRFYFFMTLMLVGVLFTLRIGDLSLYQLIFSIPGFSYIGSINRFININLIFLLLLAAEVLILYLKNFSKAQSVILGLCVLAVVDNTFKVNWEIKRFEKSKSIEEIEYISKKITETYVPIYEAIAFQFPNKEIKNAEIAFHHMATMLACQRVGLKCVNGFSERYPAHFMSFYRKTDKQALNFWLKKNEASLEGVQLIPYYW